MPGCDGLRIVTRRAAPVDAARCADIFLIARRRALPWQPADRFGHDDYYACVDDSEVIVGEVDGCVVGFVALDHTERFIRALFIHPDWQHRGVGSRLLEEAQRRLAGPAHLTCAARNQAARAFFERHGWVPVRAARREVDPHILYRKGGGLA